MFFFAEVNVSWSYILGAIYSYNSSLKSSFSPPDIDISVFSLKSQDLKFRFSFLKRSKTETVRKPNNSEGFNFKKNARYHEAGD